MNATKKQEPARNKQGQLLCAHCDDGQVETVYGRDRYGAELTSYHDCEECDATGLRACPVCGEPATIVGEGGKTAYCGVEHAFEETDWPECHQGCGRPQSIGEAPFCGASCHERFEQRVVQLHAAGR